MMRTHSLIVLLGGALFASLACGSDEPLFVTMQERTLTANGWENGGGGCMLISFGDEDGPSGESSQGTAGVGASIDGGLPPSPLSVMRSMTPGGLRIVVSSDARLLAAKLLPQKFLESGEIHRFEVSTPDGVRHEFAHRGAHDCETGVDLFAE